MQYFINHKNVKQSVKNLSSFLKEKGFDLSRNIILEAFARSIFFKNWNTLEGITSKPNIIENLQDKRSYMVEIEGSISQETLLMLFKTAFDTGNCYAVIDNFIAENHAYHFEIVFPGKTDNFLTSMCLVASALKPYKITRFDLLRIIYERESFIDAIKLDFPAKS